MSTMNQSNRHRIAGRLAAVGMAIMLAISAPVSAQADTWYKVYDHTYPTLQECHRYYFKDVEMGYKTFSSCRKTSSGWRYDSSRPW
ncbi:hypothetical protein [Microbacterium sp.]|uniref:hypothetical protein n=1 Tax=Microbacterium sp. TaxID=51671 RepID=UPI002FE05989